MDPKIKKITNNKKKTISKKLTINDILNLKRKKEKISVITSYDYWSSKICDTAGIDIILVGDSAGMVMLGYPNTNLVSMDEMLIFSKAVSNGCSKSLIVSDMPFGSYQTDIKSAVHNAVRFIKSGSNAVKLEGGLEIIEQVRNIVGSGIPVMGHIGLKPQTTRLWEGYRVQGTNIKDRSKLLKEAKELEKAGVFAIVLEMVTSETSQHITKNLNIPTIGIGSGKYCDGQVLVLHDMLNLFSDFKPKFVKQYEDISKYLSRAISNYVKDVKDGSFPQNVHSFSMKNYDNNKEKGKNKTDK
ncbi:MAG: 3-methyl-2-oxobutanoate hydroxymethyltransferase [Nitrososphaeraceae archaeon]